MAYGVTPEGFVVKPFAVIRSEVEAGLRAGIDPLLDLADQTPEGQIVAVFCGSIAELWEMGAAVYGARYPDSASDSALDEVASLTGSTRDAATKTQVVGDVTLGSIVLPAGSVAHLAARPNDRFVTLTAAGDGSPGTYSVTFEAESAGFLDVLIGQLDTIAEPVTGWTSVTNPAGPTVVGTDAESDSELRAKRQLEITQGGSTSVDAIRADLLVLAGVTAATVVEDTDAHTISAVVLGGTAQAIWDQLFASRAGGITTVGLSSGTVVDSQGVSHTEAYTAAQAQAIYVTVTIVASGAFDATNGPTAIKSAIAAYINGLSIGDDVVYDLSRCQAYSVTGVTQVTTLLQGIGSPAAAADVVINNTSYPTADVANIVVVVT